ncbi:MAG: hypothetical protein HF312_21070 [Ignavibacteria bacterium]|jgi:hypothetical protein|nr:hypothetical protein [Ignavibacteria bacterium]
MGMLTTVSRMNYATGNLDPVESTDLQVGQVIWLNGYGQERFGHERLAIYKITVSDWDKRKQYHTVNLTNFNTAVHAEYSVRHESKIFGIGLYYTTGDIATQEEIAFALTKAEEKAKARKAAEEKAEEERRIITAKGKEIFEANRPADAKAVIIAQLMADDSNSMEDYYGGHSTKTVILAFSKHERDLFPEMRKAALNCDIPEIRALADAPANYEHREKWSMGGGYYLAEGRYSGWKITKAGRTLDAEEWHYIAGQENGFYAFKKQAAVAPVEESEPCGEIATRRNEEHNGIEIIFPGKPSAAVLSELKENGWRWSKFQGLWYNRYSEDNWEFAQHINELL